MALRATDLGQGPNLRAGSGRAPCVPRSLEHEERAAAGREKKAEGPKKHIYYIYIYIVYMYEYWYQTATKSMHTSDR